MLGNRLIDSFKNINKTKQNKKMAQAVAKMENQKRLSSQEFLNLYESIWQNGPSITCQNLGARERQAQFINQNPTLY